MTVGFDGGILWIGVEGRMKRILVFIAVVTLSFACAVSLAETSASEEEPAGLVLIQAHRGASSLAPENTLSAFRAAKMIGADGIETDIRMTRDHQLVLRHEDTIDLTSNGHGSISEMTLEELKNLDFGSWYGEEYTGESILTLQELLDIAEDLNFQVLNLEMKPLGTDHHFFVRLAADTIIQSGPADRVMVSSFDGKLLKEMKQYAPTIPVALLTVPNFSLISVFRLSDYFPREKPLSEYTLEDVKEVPAALSVIMRGFGAKGRTADDVVLDVIKGIAAVVPEGATWNEAEKLIREQADLIQYVDELDYQIDCLNCHYSTLTSKLIDAMHERGIAVHVWTPDTEGELERVIALGPDGIITNEPGKALAIRNQRK